MSQYKTIRPLWQGPTTCSLTASLIYGQPDRHPQSLASRREDGMQQAGDNQSYLRGGATQTEPRSPHSESNYDLIDPELLMDVQSEPIIAGTLGAHMSKCTIAFTVCEPSRHTAGRPSRDRMAGHEGSYRDDAEQHAKPCTRGRCFSRRDGQAQKYVPYKTTRCAILFTGVAATKIPCSSECSRLACHPARRPGRARNPLPAP